MVISEKAAVRAPWRDIPSAVVEPRRDGPQGLRLAGGPDSGQRFLLCLCAILAVAAPLCLFLGVRGFAPVVGIAGLLCIPWARPTGKDRSGALILAVLVLWATISVAWSPAPNLHMPHSAKALGRLTFLHLAIQLVCCTAFITAVRRLDQAGAIKALNWIAGGVLVMLVLLTEEGFSQAKLYPMFLALFHQPGKPFWEVVEIAQGGYVVAVLAWPLGVALYRQGHPLLAWRRRPSRRCPWCC